MIVQVPKLNRTRTDPSIQGWHRETTFLKSFPPKDKANVFVIGAYSGTIAGLLINQMPEATHFLFEPQDWACRTLKEKFGHLANVTICEFGLGDRSGRFAMCLYQASTAHFCAQRRCPSGRI